ncbi:hypothetical protein JCM17380_45440 [Desulfosporosinus burensis]
MEQIEKLLNHVSKTVTDLELQQILGESDYPRFQGEVERLVESGVLAPVKASKKNGRLPPLYNKYKIIKPQEDYTSYLESIRRLNPELSIAGYLQRPEVYKKHQQIVEGISNYLWFAQGLLDKPMSRKERSFSVWGREKLLDEQISLVKDVLRFNSLAEDFLNYYDTPEPFFEYRHDLGQLTTVLVIENKDTWFTLRKLMQDTGKNFLAGTVLQVLLYGEGNKITKPGALEEYKAAMLGGEGQATRFLYFGDLDWEGIRLFFRTREANPSLELKPFAALYSLMLELAAKHAERQALPKSPDQRGVTGSLSEFLAALELAQGDNPLSTSTSTSMSMSLAGGFLKDLLAEGKYIPQEIINYQVAADLLK